MNLLKRLTIRENKETSSSKVYKNAGMPLKDYTTAIFDAVEAKYHPAEIDIYGKYEHEQIEECDRILDRLEQRNVPLNSTELWNVGEFIRMMEKVYFFQNTRESTICCDSELNTKTRVLFLPYERINAFIKITITKETDTVEIDVYREYGKKMKSHFTVINQTAQEKLSDSDIMLIHTINEYVQTTVKNLFKTYVDLIKNDSIYDTIVGGSNSGGDNDGTWQGYRCPVIRR